jgi:hypothetical protein
MEAAMFKEAFICGLGMIVDLTGSHYSYAHELHVAYDGIRADWKQVGIILQRSIDVERSKIEAEAAKQLHLKLG